MDFFALKSAELFYSKEFMDKLQLNVVKRGSYNPKNQKSLC